jgi:hypothetical protein
MEFHQCLLTVDLIVDALGLLSIAARDTDSSSGSVAVNIKLIS